MGERVVMGLVGGGWGREKGGGREGGAYDSDLGAYFYEWGSVQTVRRSGSGRK